MRFKSQHSNNQYPTSDMPTIDLIPMLTVMMGVLGFFVVISTLIAVPPDRIEVKVPNAQEPEANTGPKTSKPWIVHLKGQDEAEIAGETFTLEQVLVQLRTLLETDQAKPVALISEAQVPYETVVFWLTAMRDVGGDRVSLQFTQGERKDPVF